MKVKIFTEVAMSIGYGHLSRCIALMDELLFRNVEVDLIIYGDLISAKLLENKVYRNENWINIDYLDNNIDSEDLVIVDSYKAGVEHYELISSKSKKALYIDDNNRIQYPKGTILNPSIQSINIDYSYTQQEMVLRGSKYVILRSVFHHNIKKNLHNNVHRILVIMGGTDIKGISLTIINNICEVNKNIMCDIVLNSLQFEKLSLLNLSNNIYLHKDLSDIEILDANENIELAQNFRIRTVPNLIIVDNDKILEAYIGSEEIINYANEQR
jgi:spore coat polysaccharide biosynthesis predicted glycosyltransferase SpsG